MKKFVLIIMFIVFCCLGVNFSAFKVKAESGLALSSKSAYLIDVNSGTVLYSKNENARMPIASMTKLMLLLLTFENIDKGNLNTDEKITVSQTASGMGGSQVYLEANGEYLCSDLIKSVVMASANDASVALAERLYGSEQNAVEIMNTRAEELGMEDTLYSNCTGLTKPTQYSSAKDCAILLSQVIKHNEYFKYSTIWMDEIKHPSGTITGLTNTNKLIKFYSGCDGGKTGFTQEAGFCLSATAKRGAMRLICVVINSESSKIRNKEVSDLLNFGFDNYTEVCIIEKSESIEEKLKVLGGKQDFVEVTPQESYYHFSKKNQKINYTTQVILEKVKAPIKKGKVVGKIEIYIDNVKKGEIKLVTKSSVKEKSIIDSLKDIVLDW